VTQQKALN